MSEPDRSNDVAYVLLYFILGVLLRLKLRRSFEAQEATKNIGIGAKAVEGKLGGTCLACGNHCSQNISGAHGSEGQARSAGEAARIVTY